MLIYLSTRKVPTERDIRTAEEALERIRNDVQVRRREEKRLQGDKVTCPFKSSSEVVELNGYFYLEYIIFVLDVESGIQYHRQFRYVHTSAKESSRNFLT